MAIKIDKEQCIGCESLRILRGNLPDGRAFHGGRQSKC